MSFFLSLNEIEKFDGILDHFLANTSKWEDYCNTADPQNQPLPAPYNTQLDMFEVAFIINLELNRFFTLCIPWFAVISYCPKLLNGRNYNVVLMFS